MQAGTQAQLVGRYMDKCFMLMRYSMYSVTKLYYTKRYDDIWQMIIYRFLLFLLYDLHIKHLKRLVLKCPSPYQTFETLGITPECHIPPAGRSSTTPWRSRSFLKPQRCRLECILAVGHGRHICWNRMVTHGTLTIPSAHISGSRRTKPDKLKDRCWLNYVGALCTNYV